MSEASPNEAHGYRRPDHSGEVRAMIELAERQVERLDAVDWHFALKIAAAATVVGLFAQLLRGISATVTLVFRDLWLPGVSALLFSVIAWRLYRDHATRVRAERRTLSQAVLAAHELLPLTTHLSPMEQQELRLRLSRLPFDASKTADMRASSAPADDTPAPVRATTSA